MSLSLTRPTTERVTRVLLAEAASKLTYDDVGSTNGALPAGWATDERERSIGAGRDTFDRAVQALRRWAQFDLDWVWPVRTDVPIAEGQLFGFVARTLGVWSINQCRIVYVIDEHGDDGARFGFGYGTVGTHGVRGEERFLLRWDEETDDVRFSIRKFSRPNSWLLAALGPITRWVQRRFTHDALDRLAAEVAP